jgi:hypothetical protein
MKEAPNIDELLNGYIDEELTARQMTEVQRLIANDEGAAMRLRELQRVRILVGSLPLAEAPGHMLADIRTRLERKSLLEAEPAAPVHRRGSQSLLLRKVLSAAAMIALIGGLAAVVFVIVTPEARVNEPVAVVKNAPGTTGGDETTVAPLAGATDVLKGRLELTTGTFFAAEALVSRAIEGQGLEKKTSSETGENMAVYSVKCTRSELTLLLAELTDVWPRCESASLYVESAGEGGAWVDRIKPSQVMEIISQPNDERTIKAAKWCAIENGMTTPGEHAIASDEGIGLSIPQPALTRPSDAPGDKGYDRLIEFTIRVTGAQ